MDELVPVRVRDCACPDTPHADGDIVYLLPKLDIEGGAAAELDVITVNEMPEARRGLALIARWTATFVLYGAKAWNWTDEKGKPVPFDASVLVSDYGLARIVAEKANELYQETVLGFFTRAVGRPPKPSSNGQTGHSTSARPARTRSRSGSSSASTSVGSQSVTGP